MLTDIHTHLNHFSSDELKGFMKNPAIERVITCVYNKETLFKTIPLLKTCNNIYLSAGIHPQEAFSEKSLEFISIIEKISDSLVALGEIGYDCYPGNPPLTEQREVLDIQLKMLKNRKLPIIIHCRGAFETLFSHMDSVTDKLGYKPDLILHSYSGGFKYLDESIRRGYYISFGGSLTFKRSSRLKKIASIVPLNRILCETDSPFIPPEKEPPEEKSTPEDIQLVFNSIVKERSENKDTVEEEIRKNVKSLFDFEKIDRNRKKWMNLLEKSLKEIKY